MSTAKFPNSLSSDESLAVNRVIAHPWPVYLIWVVFSSLLFFNPLRALIEYALNNESASHILIVPLIVAGLFFLNRDKLFGSSSFDVLAAFPFVLAAALIGVLSVWKASPQFELSALTLSWLLLLISGFIAIFGRATARAEWFSLAMLGFAIPLPEPILNWLIYVLQSGSAAVTGWVFDLSGVANWREGFVFHLAGWNIEVAKECSGIRSSMALLILAVLIAHFSFTKFWKKALFVTAGLLMMVIKNGVRIAVLTLLAKYVDPNFLFGHLHHDGGVVFFLLGLALLVPVYWLLRRDDPSAFPTSLQTHT
jgi:exosortase